MRDTIIYGCALEDKKMIKNRQWEGVSEWNEREREEKEQERQNICLTICGGRLESVAEALSVSVGFLNLLQGFCSSQLHQRPKLLQSYPKIVWVVSLHSSTPLWIELHPTVRHVAYGSCRWHCQLFSLWRLLYLPVQIYWTHWDSVSVARDGERLNCAVLVLNVVCFWYGLIFCPLSSPSQISDWLSNSPLKEETGTVRGKHFLNAKKN